MRRQPPVYATIPNNLLTLHNRIYHSKKNWQSQFPKRHKNTSHGGGYGLHAVISRYAMNTVRMDAKFIHQVLNTIHYRTLPFLNYHSPNEPQETANSTREGLMSHI